MITLLFLGHTIPGVCLVDAANAFIAPTHNPFIIWIGFWLRLYIVVLLLWRFSFFYVVKKRLFKLLFNWFLIFLVLTVRIFEYSYRGNNFGGTYFSFCHSNSLFDLMIRFCVFGLNLSILVVLWGDGKIFAHILILCFLYLTLVENFGIFPNRGLLFNWTISFVWDFYLGRA